MIVDDDKIINDLKKILKDNKTNVIAFVGAGTSIIPGLPSWDNVLEKFNHEFQAGISVKRELDKGYAETASLIFSKKNDNDGYVSFMQKQFIAEKTQAYNIHTLIINIVDTIITTNYDNCFEKAYHSLNGNPNTKQIKYKIQVLPDFNITRLVHNPTLIYLHGHISKTKYIFRKEEYDEYYQASNITNNDINFRQFLNSVITNYNLLFVGFSFNDKIFFDFFRECMMLLRDKRNQYPQTIIPDHFAIIQESQLREHLTSADFNLIKTAPKNLLKLGIIKMYKENYIFTPDAESKIQALTTNKKDISVLLKRLKETTENKARKEKLKECNVSIIEIENGRYIDIESILEHLNPMYQNNISNTFNSANHG